MVIAGERTYQNVGDEQNYMAVTSTLSRGTKRRFVYGKVGTSTEQDARF